MASNYDIIAKLVLDLATAKKQIEELQNKQITLRTTVKATSADVMEKQVATWNSQLTRMKLKFPKWEGTAESKQAIDDVVSKMEKYQVKGQQTVSKANVDTSMIKARTEIDRLTTGINNNEKSWQNWGDMLGVAVKKIIIWYAATELVMGALKKLGEGIQFIKDLNKELTNARIVTGDSAESAKKMGVEYNKLAQDLGVTTKEVAAGSVEWLRAGKTAAETQKLLTDSTMLSKIANIDAAKSTEYVISIMNGYKLSVEDVTSALDVLVALDNKYSTSTAEIAGGMKEVANTASSLGVSYTDLASQIAVVSSVSRDGAESVGTAFKSIYSRMAMVKAGKEIDDAGESLSDVEKVLNRYGIAVRNSQHEFRNMSDVLADAAKKYKEFGDAGKTAEQGQIRFALAGRNQMEVIATLFNNWDKFTTAQGIAMESGGTMLSRFQIYLQGIEASQNRMTAAWENFWIAAMPPEALTYFYNLSASILQVAASIVSADSVMTNWNKFLGLGMSFGDFQKGWGDFFTGVNSQFQQTFDKYQNLAKTEIALGAKLPNSLTTPGKESSSEPQYIPTGGGTSSAQSQANKLQQDYNDILKDTVEMLKQRKNAEKDALQDELSNYKNLIDAKKEEIDLSHKSQEYLDELADKNKSLADIENELFELQNDHSETANAKRLNLEDKKAKQIKEINKYQADKSVDDQKSALDKDYENFKTTQDEKIKVIDDYLKQTGTITREAIDLLTNHAEQTYADLIQWNRIYGSGIDSDITDKWKNAIDVIKNGLKEVGSSVGGAMGTAQNAVANATANMRSDLSTLDTQWMTSGGIWGDIINQVCKNVDNLRGKLSDTQLRWNSIVNDMTGAGVSSSTVNKIAGMNPITMRHSGIDAGFVGDVKSNEEFAKLMKGELVINPSQMTNFMNKVLPSLVSNTSTMGNMSINIPITVEGNMDKSILPNLENMITRVVTDAMKNRGLRTNVNAYSV